MSDPTFVDASAWYAIVDPRDHCHTAAKATYTDLLQSDTPLVTTNWVVYEALSLLKARAGLRRAQELWRVVNDPAIVLLVYITEEDERTGLDLFFRFTDKMWGVVDCVSFVVMERLGLSNAFGFDKHFTEASRQRGFVVIP